MLSSSGVSPIVHTAGTNLGALSLLPLVLEPLVQRTPAATGETCFNLGRYILTVGNSWNTLEHPGLDSLDQRCAHGTTNNPCRPDHRSRTMMNMDRITAHTDHPQV
ncbi:hypothetical protein BO71DRAFT_21466 [Aspergillus ellipticus CBS 707.79]|uniref:Uncharacterized protein n=1 Tax=Aspergillus ellipticus CBS 707.79 TaxID=1448320 RepID=A0A319D5E7_9EURO|nr:hypothetical protein BO71DRAFT_21466 [Aspergillus ellipticus CBS 707.79]